MTAKSKFLNAVSVMALSVSFMVPAGMVVSTLATSVANAATVRTVEVNGNKRVDSQTVRQNIKIVPGRNFTTVDIDESVKQLFAMGLFSDVKIRQSGQRLIVTVSEYEMVNQILFQGNKKIKDPDLLRTISLQPRSSFDPIKLKSDEQMIRDAYRYVGRNDAVVTSETVNLGQGRVNIIFKVTEGKKTTIDDIVFEGNSHFGDRRLRDVIATKRSGMLSWLTRGDVYSDDRLAADEEALRRFYYNRGYADFQVLSSSATFDEATNSYKITFVLDEGARYKLGDVLVDTTVEGIDVDNLRRALKTQTGDVYSAKRVEDSIVEINDFVADSGYAFAKVEPRGDRDFENHTISIVYNIDQGPRAYVERIEIRGNDKTRDYVIRRELDLNEGDAFNQTLIQRAKRRLDALGFFQSVNISANPGSEPDQVVLVVDIAERSTGEFSIGGGYTTGGETPGLSVEASITERNFLGRGQYVRIGAGAGEDDAQNYNISFTDPYFLGYRLSSGFDVFRRTYRMNDEYDVGQTGGALRFGVPITENLVANLAYNYVQEEYELDENWYDYSQAIVEAAQNSPWTRSSVSYGFTYNSVDDMRNPHDGLFLRVNQEYAGLGGDANFLKTSGKAMLYKTISDQLDIVGLLSGGAGYVYEIGDDNVRIFDMFRSSSDMIRGFKYNGIGPRQFSNSGELYYLGGTTYMNASAELQFPMPVVPDSLGMRAAVFADAATLYGNSYEVSVGENPVEGLESQWRASAGVSLMWASPFGPLRFDYAWPIMKQDGDQIQNFNFGVSTKF